MNWAQLDIGSTFLVLSVLAGAGAAALLLHAAARSRPRKATFIDSTLPVQLYSGSSADRRGPNLLDRVTLLNKNLVQCRNCSMIDYANARFCIRCGMPMQSQVEPLRGYIRDVEARYLAQDGSNRMVGLSIGLDPETRLGVIIGIQKREPPQSMNENRN